jgi:peroxiredoxin
LWLLLVVGLCIANGLLIKQNRDLRAVIAYNQPQFLEPGQQAPPLAAKSLSGQRRVIDYAAYSKTVLLVFSPQCPACERTAPHWRQIRAACARNQYQILAVSLGDGPKSEEFLKSHGIDLEVLADVDAETRRAYRLNLTPLTIVMDSGGNVERVWPGVFKESKPEVERYFGISLMDEAK